MLAGEGPHVIGGVETAARTIRKGPKPGTLRRGLAGLWNLPRIPKGHVMELVWSASSTLPATACWQEGRCAEHKLP